MLKRSTGISPALQLEEKARMKEQALRRSELILEEDAMRFETFLKVRGW